MKFKIKVIFYSKLSSGEIKKHIFTYELDGNLTLDNVFIKIIEERLMYFMSFTKGVKGWYKVKDIVWGM